MSNGQNKKVTFLIESLTGGGAERVTSVLANALCDNSFDVNIIIINKAENEYLIRDEIKKYYPNLEQSAIKYIKHIKRIRPVNNLIKKIDSNVIISLAMPVTNILLIPSLLFSKRKIILSERNDPNNFPKSKVHRIVRNLLYKMCNIVVFQTDDAKGYFSRGIQKKGVVIPNPIKEDLPQAYNGKRKYEIVNFCRLDEQKNLTMLIDAFKLLTKSYPDYRLSIYGEGPLKNELIEYAEKKMDKGMVNLKGYEKNIHDKIIDCKMFVSSSNYEGISNSMLEALAIGLPTICTDCPAGGAKMFIRPYENGLLVPIGDTITLYKAMKEIIENQELSDKISKNAVNIREELSTTNIVKRWLEVIES